MRDIAKNAEQAPDIQISESSSDHETKPKEVVKVGMLVAIKYMDFPDDDPIVFKIINPSDNEPNDSMSGGERYWRRLSTDKLSRAVLEKQVDTEIKFTGIDGLPYTVKIVDFRYPPDSQ